MNDFIFHKALKAELQYLIDNPLKLGGVLGFHGSYGIGKTAFAKYIGNLLANEVIHYDCASKKSLILEDIELRNRTVSLASFCDTETEKVFERCFILDEFHSFPDRSKASYKIPLENLVVDNRSLIIIIANTDAKYTLIKAIDLSIASRVHPICFDIKECHYKEVIAMIKKRFPVLSDEYILETLPDMRQICKRAKLLS
jgi:replication-associated recombination protein RarA